MKDSISDLSTLTVKKPSKRKSIKIGNIYIYLHKKLEWSIQKCILLQNKFHPSMIRAI